MTGENRYANAVIEIENAEAAIRACEGLLSLGLPRDAMSRAYYAAFHAARALLLLEGIEAKTHAGTFRLVAQHLVRAGKLPPEIDAVLVKLQGLRHESDYGYAFDIAPADAQQALVEARAFVVSASCCGGVRFEGLTDLTRARSLRRDGASRSA